MGFDLSASFATTSLDGFTDITTPISTEDQKDTRDESTIQQSQSTASTMEPGTMVAIMMPASSNNVSSNEALKNGFAVSGTRSSVGSMNDLYQSSLDAFCKRVLDSWNASIRNMADFTKVQEKTDLQKVADQKVDDKRVDDKKFDDKKADEKRTSEDSAMANRGPPPIQSIIENFQSRLNVGDKSARNNVVTMTSMLVISASFIGNVGGSMQAMPASETPFNVICDSIGPIQNMIPSDMRAELGLIGAMFATGAMYQAAVVTVAKGVAGPNIDLKFAKNYAAQTIGWIKSEEFNNFLGAMFIGKTENGQPITEERKKQIAAIMKVTLLMNALALIEKVQIGHLTGEELKAMIDPEGAIKIGANDSRAPLIQLIRENLKQMTEPQKEELLSSLFAYYETQPKLEKLTEPVNDFKALFKDSAVTLAGQVNAAQG